MTKVSPVPFTYLASPPITRERPVDIRRFFRFLLSNGWLIGGSTVAAAAAMLAYITVTPPTYVSNAQLMLDSQTKTTDAQRNQAEDGLVEGQIEIIKSGDVLLAVVRELRLSSDSEFRSTRLPLVDTVRSLFSERGAGGADAKRTRPQEDVENFTIAALRNRLWVRRVGRSTVIEISAASSDPRKAATIANTVAEQYLAHNVARNSEAARQSSEWLAQRVAELKEEVLRADRAAWMFKSSGDPNSQFRLTELKRTAETYLRLYDSYLQSWSEARQRISYPVSDAAFVSRGAVPVVKSQPKGALVLAFACLLGVSFGIVAATIRHFANDLITSAERMAADVNTPCIGEITLAVNGRKQKKLAGTALLRLDDPDRQQDAQGQRFKRDLKDLRATIHGLRRNRKLDLIGVVGAETNVGATTLAYNLALLAATAGSKTLLIDACETSPTLSSACFEAGTVGLVEILNAPSASAGACGSKPLAILPIGSCKEAAPGGRIGLEHIAVIIADLRERFEFVVVDLPPLSRTADAKSIAPYLDASIVVVRYGTTSLEALATAVDALHEVGAEILGVVLNASPRLKK
ncbi:Wzz/FepE/Etk N-terminal domain-containing protein [Rhizobium sp. BK251]|uniref:GumC family protein n=1 Tax=Rhizobium sp. BK251 TaxID=2512125 RepID=UPI0010D264F1|nr:Wzz/FepE/Etk N-terminal domain-containing protein [Rhizobium sp. BK251]TCL66378.1 subunit length determinant protein [Rhizobium sp. BK251]